MLDSNIGAGEILHTDEMVFFTRYSYSFDGVEGDISVIALRGQKPFGVSRFRDTFNIIKREFSVGGLWMRGAPPSKGTLIKNLSDGVIFVIKGLNVDIEGNPYVEVCSVDGKYNDITFSMDGTLLMCVEFNLPHNDVE